MDYTVSLLPSLLGSDDELLQASPVVHDSIIGRHHSPWQIFSGLQCLALHEDSKMDNSAPAYFALDSLVQIHHVLRTDLFLDTSSLTSSISSYDTNRELSF